MLKTTTNIHNFRTYFGFRDRAPTRILHVRKFQSTYERMAGISTTHLTNLTVVFTPGVFSTGFVYLLGTYSNSPNPVACYASSMTAEESIHSRQSDGRQCDGSLGRRKRHFFLIATVNGTLPSQRSDREGRQSSQKARLPGRAGYVDSIRPTRSPFPNQALALPSPNHDWRWSSRWRWREVS